MASSNVVGTAMIQIIPEMKQFASRVKTDVTQAIRSTQGAITSQVKSTTRAVENELDGMRRRSQSRMSQLLAGIGTAIGSMARTIGTGVAAGLGALATFGVTVGIKTASQLEQAAISYETLIGSSDEAKKHISDLIKFAARTPFELTGLMQADKMLLGAGVSAGDTLKVLTSLGNATSGLGLGQEQFGRIMLATTQMMNKGKVSAEEMNQLVEAGIPAWKLLSESTGKPIPELMKLGEQGKLLSKDVLPGLFTQMNKDYPAAMIKQSKTLQGVWSTFKDTLSIALAEGLQPLLPVLEKWIPRAAEAAVKALTWVFDTIKTGSAWVQAIWESAKKWVGSVISGVVQGIKTGDWSALSEALSVGFRKAFDKISDLGKTIVDVLAKVDWKTVGAAVGSALITAIMVGGNIGRGIVELFGQIDWFKLGEAVGRQAIPFAVGFNKTLIDGLISTIRHHPLDLLFFVLTFIGIGKLAGTVAKVLERIPILRVFAPLFRWLDNLIGPLADRGWKIIRGFVEFFGRSFGRAFREVFPKTAKLLDDWWVIVRVVLSELPGKMLKIGRAIVGGLIEGVESMTTAVFKAILRVIAVVLRPFARAGGWLIRAGAEVVGGLIRGVVSMLAPVASAAARVIRTLTSPFRGAAGWLFQAGRNLVLGLRNGFLSLVGGVGGWVKRLGTAIVNEVKRFFGISSPSTVMAGMGRNLATGFVQGVADAHPVEFISKIFGSMPAALAAIVGKGLVSISSLPGRALSALAGLGGKLAGVLGFGGGGGNVANQALGRVLAAGYGWVGAQWDALRALWSGESGWNNLAQNPTSSAFGIAQFLNSTWAAVGARKTTDPAQQIVAGLRYIAASYGSPAAAYGAWLSRSPHWYDDGGMLPPGLSLAVNNTGRPEPVGGLVLTQQNIEDAVFNALAHAHRAGISGSDVLVQVDGNEMKKVIQVESRKAMSASANSLKVGRR